MKPRSFTLIEMMLTIALVVASVEFAEFCRTVVSFSGKPPNLPRWTCGATPADRPSVVAPIALGVNAALKEGQCPY
jgi:hypothetical protein